MKKYEAMVLSCMDPRFQPKVYRYLNGKKLTGKYSSFTIAGSAIGVTHKKFKKWHSTFIDNLSTSIKLHKINKLIVINHRDCGAAKIVNDNKKLNFTIENKIRQSESQKYGFCLGMEGGLYSMRKSAWQPIPPLTFMEDFFQTVQLIQNDQQIYYSDTAFGYEDVSTSLQEEFKRKKRISIGNYQNLKRFRGLLLKKVYPFGWIFLFHKILRWTTPQAIIIGILALIFTPFALPIFVGVAVLLLLELLFYRGAGPLVYFCAMNLAMLQGYLTYLQGVSSSVWQPTKRNQDEP